MAGNSYTLIPIPQSPLVDSDGIVGHVWQLFFANLAAGIFQATRQVVIDGFGFTTPPGVRNVIFDPAGVLATGTVIMPPNVTNWQEITYLTSKTITACTFTANSGQTIVNAPTTLIAGASASFIFCQQTGAWYKK